ncbi:biotin-dependent carboxyltransferase family protein [Jatrophihabitans sp.]|uniref:5-oxoprolinase subunit C family protein n=1 Tax=Jatrophihabitans sp. TaxID=1932789 RepID=UPI0030C70782|nr:allophanate hydrolase [Jatrophihabitans sp.]
MIEIVSPGPLTTTQDLGRPGSAALGVPRSGAFDRAAAALANRLVGNPADAALLELTLGGLVFRALDAATVALTGAACDGLGWGTPVSLPAGSLVRLGTPRSGLRSYLAVRGGLAVERVLGSASTDLLSGLGPERLTAGDLLAVDPQPSGPVSEQGATPRLRTGPALLLPGPRLDWFTPEASTLLTTTRWLVRPDSDRVGVRLDGPALPRIDATELPSEATRPGALQVPPDGRPIVFGPDAPVTGGYPVIAVLADLDDVAQLRPGDPVSFRF